MQLLKESVRSGYLPKLTYKQGLENFTVRVHMTSLLIDMDLASVDFHVVVWRLPSDRTC